MMKHINIILVCTLFFATACSSAKDTSPNENRIERPPIIEVTQNQLDLENMMIEAMKQQMQGNDEEALRSYRKLLSKQPDYGPAHYEMCLIMAKTNRLDSAIAHGELARTSDINNKWYHQALANLYSRNGLTKKAIVEWETLTSQHPDVLDYYYELSNAYLAANNISKAIDVLNRVEKKIGVTEPISLQKQKLWIAMGKNDKGEKELEALAESLPQEVRYNTMLAEARMREKDYAKAKVYFDRVLALHPNDGYTNISIAEYYKAIGEHENAYQALKKGVANADLSVQNKLQILRAFYPGDEFYGQYSRYAFNLMDQIMKSCDDSTSYALFYGDILVRQKKYAEALHQFELHLSKDSSRYDVWEALLVCANESNCDEKTIIQYAERASRLFPMFPLPYYMLAESHHNLGNDAEAFKCFETYLSIQPDDPGMLNNYAYYLAEAGLDLEKAATMIKKALSQEPNNATFLDTYAWILYKLGSDEACPVIKEAVQASKEKRETINEHYKTICHE